MGKNGDTESRLTTPPVLLVAATLAEEAEDYSYPEIRMSAAAPVREGTRRLAAGDDVLTSYTVFLTHAPRHHRI